MAISAHDALIYLMIVTASSDVALTDQELHRIEYALAVEVAAVDLKLEQEELRFLEMIRDRLELDRLVTAAIETAARARHRRLVPNTH
jgi:uncharacterized membrane protein YebE (DUF533 family)